MAADDNNTSETYGFPELIWEPRCRICKLAKVQPGLLKLVHRLHREDPLMGGYAIATRIRAAFDRQGIQCPSPRAIDRHFEVHIRDEVNHSADDLAMPDPVEATFERLAATEAELANLHPADLALGRNDSDYHSMADLFRRVMRRVAALDADPTAFVNPDGTHSPIRLNTWSGMVSNAKSILEGLNKMRNSDRMTVSILEQHTKRYASAIAQPLSVSLRDIARELDSIDHPKARELGHRLNSLLTHEVTQIFVDAARRSMQESKAEYKLLN